MTLSLFETQRAMRQRREAALRRGVVAVLDIGSSKVACLILQIAADPAAPDHNYYFDGVTYHLYYNPREMFDIVTGVRAGLDSFGLEDKQVWVNETNAPPTDDPLEPPPDEPQFAVSSAEQAAFVIQAFALLVAGGADRIALYKFRNDPDAAGVIEPFGLLRADNSRRPAFDAFKVVTTYFSGYTNYSWVHQGNFYIVTLDRGEQTTTVLWNTSSEDRPFAINAIAPQAMLVDPTGAVRPITAAGGVYTIVLPGATCPGEACVI
ncbi:MAG: hypothetical protein ACE5FS_03735, partial [Paracoccaceae bacterium]